MSNLLSSRDLVHIRETHESHMPDLLRVERRVLVDDGFGGVSHDPHQVIATDVPCRVTEAQQQDMGAQGGRDLQVEKWTIRVPLGTDIQDEDFLVWTSTTPTRRFQVEDVKDRTNEGVMSIKAEVVK